MYLMSYSRTKSLGLSKVDTTAFTDDEVEIVASLYILNLLAQNR